MFPVGFTRVYQTISLVLLISPLKTEEVENKSSDGPELRNLKYLSSLSLKTLLLSIATFVYKAIF